MSDKKKRNISSEEREKRRLYMIHYHETHKEEEREKRKKYHAEHREELNKKSLEYYYSHHDERTAKHREYVAKNSEKVAKQSKLHYEENKEEILAKKKENDKKNRNILSEKDKKYKNSPAKYDVYYPKISLYYSVDEIRRDLNNPELLQIRCHNQKCREWFNPTVLELNNRIGAIDGRISGEAHLYCSNECKKDCLTYRRSKYLKGQAPKKYDREVQPELRKMVLERDKYTCQKCGKSQNEFPELILHCHHVKPINEDPICSADVDNCITLCAECHRWVHMNVPGCSVSELRCSEKK